MDVLRRPAPAQPPITITHKVHTQQTDYLTMNLKKMNGVPVPAPRSILRRPVPAPRKIRGRELLKLVFSDAPCIDEAGGYERPLGPNAPRVPVHAGSQQLEAAEGQSGDPSSNPTPVNLGNRRRQKRRRRKKEENKIRMIRMADKDSSSDEEETSQEMTAPPQKCYNINVVKPLSEIIQISGRLHIHRIQLSDIEEDQPREEEEKEEQDGEDDQEDDTDAQDSEAGGDFEPTTELEIGNDTTEDDIGQGDAVQAELDGSDEGDVERYEGAVYGEEGPEAYDDFEEKDDPNWDKDEDHKEEEEEENDEEGRNGDEVKEDDPDGQDYNNNQDAIGSQRWVTDQISPYEYEEGGDDHEDEGELEVDDEEGEDDDEFEVGEEYEDEEHDDDNDSICDVYDSCDEYDYYDDEY